MNRQSILAIAAAALAFAAVPSQAAMGVGEGTPGYPHETQALGSASRAEVRAEAQRAVAEGRVATGEIGLKADAPLVSTVVSRAAVRAEAAEAVRLGLVATGERSVVYTQPQLAQLKAAAERATTIVVAGQR